MRMHVGHYEFMALMRRAALSDRERLLFVHAGIDPAKPLDKQADNFWWGHRDFIALDQSYLNFKRIFAGYNPYIKDYQSYPLITFRWKCW